MGEDRWNDVLAHRDRLLRIAMARCGSREDAEDVVHDAMLRCVGFADLDPERLGAFLTTVTLRLCVDVHRRHERGERAVRRLPAPDPQVADPEELACRASEFERLTGELARLPANQRRAIVDRAEGLSVPQIARRHGLTYKAAESALSRARTALRASLAGIAAVVVAARRLRGQPVLAPAIVLVVAVAALPWLSGTTGGVLPEASSRPDSSPSPGVARDVRERAERGVRAPVAPARRASRAGVVPPRAEAVIDVTDPLVGTRTKVDGIPTDPAELPKWAAEYLEKCRREGAGVRVDHLEVGFKPGSRPAPSPSYSYEGASGCGVESGLPS